MPSSTPERQARWKDDSNATAFLTDRGYKLTREWEWVLPTPDHVPTEDEIDAINYMVEEWDYGGLIKSEDEPRERITITIDEKPE